MKYFRYFIIALSINIIACTSLSSNETHFYDPGPGWKLVFTDEFDSDQINAKNWTHDSGFGPNNDGWGLWGLQDYTTDSEYSYIKDGKLVLKADFLGGDPDLRNYKSAKLTSKGKQSWQYGKIAARIKFPYGKGIFPAFWMLGDNLDIIDWPKCGEIDIGEMFGGGEGKDDTNMGTIHYYDASLGHHVYDSGNIKLPEGEKLANNFHIYTIEWDKNKIVFKFDGQEYHRSIIDTAQKPQRDEFHHKFFLIFNLGVGAYFDVVGHPDETTKFPQYMEVDWVRVYK